MSRTKHQRSLGRLCTEENAASLLELALVMPLVALVVFFSLEVGRFLLVRERLGAICREGASEAFRDCAQRGKTGVHDGGQCLIDKGSKLAPFAARVVPKARLVLSFAKSDPTFHPPILFKQKEFINGVPQPPSSSIKRFSVNSFWGMGEFALLMSQHQVLGMSEIYYVYKPIVPFFGRLLLGVNSNGEIRQSAIY